LTVLRRGLLAVLRGRLAITGLAITRLTRLTVTGLSVTGLTGRAGLAVRLLAKAGLLRVLGRGLRSVRLIATDRRERGEQGGNQSNDSTVRHGDLLGEQLPSFPIALMGAQPLSERRHECNGAVGLLGFILCRVRRRTSVFRLRRATFRWGEVNRVAFVPAAASGVAVCMTSV
jgi:hypothetical protein